MESAIHVVKGVIGSVIFFKFQKLVFKAFRADAMAEPRFHPFGDIALYRLPGFNFVGFLVVYPDLVAIGANGQEGFKVPEIAQRIVESAYIQQQDPEKNAACQTGNSADNQVLSVEIRYVLMEKKVGHGTEVGHDEDYDGECGQLAICCFQHEIQYRVKYEEPTYEKICWRVDTSAPEITQEKRMRCQGDPAGQICQC